MPEDAVCPIAEAAALLGDKWTLIILRDLGRGTKRFSELERSGEGITPSVLTTRLRELEARGLVTRTSYAEIPPRVEYVLTKMGADALDVVASLEHFGQKWLLDVKQAASSGGATASNDVPAGSAVGSASPSASGGR